MNSGSHRGFTIVTIVTLIFAPFLVHHHWAYRLVDVKTETHVEQCATPHPCPPFKTVVVKIKPPLPLDPPKLPGENSTRQPAGHRH